MAAATAEKKRKVEPDTQKASEKAAPVEIFIIVDTKEGQESAGFEGVNSTEIIAAYRTMEAATAGAREYIQKEYSMYLDLAEEAEIEDDPDDDDGAQHSLPTDFTDHKWIGVVTEDDHYVPTVSVEKCLLYW